MEVHLANWHKDYKWHNDMITFYHVDTLGKIKKLIEAYNKIVKGNV